MSTHVCEVRLDRTIRAQFETRQCLRAALQPSIVLQGRFNCDGIDGRQVRQVGGLTHDHRRGGYVRRFLQRLADRCQAQQPVARRNQRSNQN